MADRSERVNILLVDDQPAKLLSYEVILRELEENLIVATSARAALEQLLRHDVAVILIDVCMPELDGFELAAMIREHPRFERTTIIFVSAVQISDPDLLRGYQAGAVDYVPVPVVPELLRAKVRVFAELYRKTRQLEAWNSELEERVAERTAALETTATELKKLNNDLEHRIEERTREREAALAQLFEAQKLDTIGQLTGGVAHDFNNLLTVILGSLRLLGKRLPDDQHSRCLLENALAGAERGASLTQRLLSFARRQELNLEPVDIGHLIAGMDELLKRALGPLITVKTSFPSVLPLLHADAHQLELALLNLAINARDAMPQGGTLVLSANAELGGSVAGDYVSISISDQGEGMAPDILARATEPFFTTKGTGKGTGLGLSMVHGFAAQSGGSLTIASEIGRGTTVELRLPIAAGIVGNEPSEKPTAITRPDAARSLSVLVVDDDALVNFGTVAMLEDLGHVANEAFSGGAALDLLRSGRHFDVVLTDHAMPKMTGAQLARIIKLEFPGMPIVLASGYAEIKPEETELCDYRLSKPFGSDQLQAILSQVAHHVVGSTG